MKTSCTVPKKDRFVFLTRKLGSNMSKHYHYLTLTNKEKKKAFIYITDDISFK